MIWCTGTSVSMKTYLFYILVNHNFNLKPNKSFQEVIPFYQDKLADNEKVPTLSDNLYTLKSEFTITLAQPR